MHLTNNIKKIFLSFAQGYFAQAFSPFLWNVDPKRTKIFIGDRNIAAPAVIEKLPSIILSRGTMSYAQTSIDQRQFVDTASGPFSAKQRTDLVRGSITFNCSSSNAIEAEEIANIIFLNIVGFKDEFRERGIHQILGTSIGEEQVVRGDVVPRLVVVPVTVLFTAQASIITTDDLYSVQVFFDTYLEPKPQIRNEDNFYYEDDIYGYVASGNTLTFSRPPASGTVIKVNYKGRYTLTSYTNVTPAGIIDGSNDRYLLPEAIYTPYYTYSGLTIHASGLTN